MAQAFTQGQQNPQQGSVGFAAAERAPGRHGSSEPAASATPRSIRVSSAPSAARPSRPRSSSAPSVASRWWRARSSAPSAAPRPSAELGSRLTIGTHLRDRASRMSPTGHRPSPPRGYPCSQTGNVGAQTGNVGAQTGKVGAQGCRARDRAWMSKVSASSLRCSPRRSCPRQPNLACTSFHLRPVTPVQIDEALKRAPEQPDPSSLRRVLRSNERLEVVPAWMVKHSDGPSAVRPLHAGCSWGDGAALRCETRLELQPARWDMEAGRRLSPLLPALVAARPKGAKRWDYKPTSPPAR
jgi:hypothetical protein